MVTALYPGSFDPVTIGHVDLVRRACQMFTHLVVGVYINPPKAIMFDADDRVSMMKVALEGIADNVDVVPYSGLTVQAAAAVGATVVVRGLRIGGDFEYEREMALMNRHLDKVTDTVCLISSLENQFISSSRVKEILTLGGDVETLVPANVYKMFLKKIGLPTEKHKTRQT